MFLLPLADRRGWGKKDKYTFVVSQRLGRQHQEKTLLLRGAALASLFTIHKIQVSLSNTVQAFHISVAIWQTTTYSHFLSTPYCCLWYPSFEPCLPSKNTSVFHIHKVIFIFKIIQLFLIATFKVQTSAYLQHSFDKTCTNVYLSFNIQVILKTQLVRDLRFINICPFLF